MIRHIVWWTLKDRADGFSAAQNAQRILAASAALKDIPAVHSVEVSADIEPSSTARAQIVLQSTHDSPEALQEYAVHPVHLEFARLIQAACENRQALDYRVD
ncbi:MAG: Dabb family protein [Desulfovibrionaceae bacterium]|nr:Dabb family protein [Desulfovibrionaceae bacterium]